MLWIKPLILISILWIAFLYPIIKATIKKKRINQEIYERSQRTARNRLRQTRHQEEDAMFQELARRRNEFIRRHENEPTEPQEEFLTERDFQL